MLFIGWLIYSGSVDSFKMMKKLFYNILEIFINKIKR